MSEPYPKGTHEWGNAICLFVYLSPSSVFLCTWKKKQCKTKKITAASGSVCQLLPTAQSEVMKVEYWPAKFLLTSFMDGDGVEVYKQAKKERGQYPAILTEQIWSIKDRFIIWIQRILPRGWDIWVIDQLWGQGGWILAKLFFACLWTETTSRSINSQKKNKANIQPSWPNKIGQ